MRLKDFDYLLPKELIAQKPLPKRDTSRLMVVDRKNKKISHKKFFDLLEYLEPQDLLVLNNTKVIPARIFGYKKDTLGKVDVVLSRKLTETRFEVLAKPSLIIGQELIFNHGSLRARVIEGKILEFNNPVSEALLPKIGFMPLPPYIKRRPTRADDKQYQTVYAKEPGAIASPTAGLHFTKSILEKIKSKSVGIAYLTLYVGVGTFKPVKCDDIKNHIMDAEEFSISRQTLKAVKDTKRNGGRIFSVGTTTTRALETVSDLVTGHWSLVTMRKHTNLFIYPGYRFKVVDCLLTNFHLPRTTLFMLVCAFAGKDLIIQAYRQAIKARYRFYSYGDAMLII